MKPLWFGLTHIGYKREKNEDSFFIPDNISQELLEGNGYLFAVADGMGGHEGGEVASAIATKALQEFYGVIIPRDITP